MKKALGIFREVTNSPNRETDDALILQAVLEQLKSLGFQTRAATPEESDSIDFPKEDFAVVIPMCESYPRIVRLLDISTRSRALWMNSPQAVLNCYRTRMIPALSEFADVRFTTSEVRRVENNAGERPNFPAPDGYWLKRGDVHNTCDRDVVRAKNWGEAAGILREFARREITHYGVQPHIEGDLVKFYGAGPGHWFTWFYHDPVRAKRHAFEVDELADSAAAGAWALDLRVFGGDAIITPDGAVSLIDLNSWPSFALVRKEAAVQIAWQIQKALKKTADRALPRGSAASEDGGAAVRGAS